MSAVDGSDFRRRIERVAVLVESLETHSDPTARETARELVRTLLDLHAASLEKMLVLADAKLVDQFARDGLISSVLLLHGLHPHSPDDRVRYALDQSRSRFHAMGGDVELIAANDEQVKLRLRGDCSANEDLREATESLVLETVPDVVSLEFEEAWDISTVGRVPLPLYRGDR